MNEKYKIDMKNSLFLLRMVQNQQFGSFISPNEKYIAVMAQTAIGMPTLVMSNDPKNNSIIEKRPMEARSLIVEIRYGHLL